MSTEVFKAGAEVMRMVQDLIRSNHPHLVVLEDQIVVMMREKAKKVAGGGVVCGNASKVSPRLSVWTDKAFNYKFQIEIPSPLWADWNDKERLAVLDHFLCFLGVEEDEESGELKTFIRAPDVVFFAEEFDRLAEYRPVSDAAYLGLEKVGAAKAAQGKPFNSMEVVTKKKAPPRSAPAVN